MSASEMPDGATHTCPSHEGLSSYWHKVEGRITYYWGGRRWYTVGSPDPLVPIPLETTINDWLEKNDA